MGLQIDFRVINGQIDQLENSSSHGVFQGFGIIRANLELLSLQLNPVKKAAVGTFLIGCPLDQER